MACVIKLCIACILLSQSAFGMEVLLDDRERIALRDPLPSLINTQEQTQPPHFWLKQDYSTEQYQNSIQPSPLTSWHKLELTAQFNGPYSQERIISIESHILRHLNLYLFDGDKLVKQANLGLLDRILDKDQPFTGTNFHFYIQNNQHLTLLIERQNDGPAILPMTIYKEDTFSDLVRLQDFFWASIISVIIAMAIYNVFVYAMHPSLAYLWYLGFHSIAFFYFSALNGYGYLILPQAIQVWLAQNIMFLNFLLIFFVINFSNVFLQSKENAPWHYRYMPHFRIITALGGAASLYVAEYNMIPFFVVFQFSISIFGISMGIVALKNGFSPAKYFLLSWMFTLTGGAVGMATVVNVLPINFITLHAFLFGSILELFLLSVALASRMKHMENSLLNQLYYYPDTDIANFSYLKNKLPEHIEDIKQQYSNPVFILADMQGFREVVSLYGPNVLTKLYKEHTDRINHFLSISSWSVPLPMPIGKPVYLVGLPAEQVLCIINLQDLDSLKIIIDNLMQDSESVLNSKQITNRIQLTLGCAILGENSVQDAFRQAQIALLSSIKTNKKWLLYDEEQNQVISQRISLLHELQMAINQNDLSIYIQPQINLIDDSINGGEILLRWNHIEKGSISPARFIPLAEQGGLIFKITQLVFIKSCRWLAQLKNKGLLNNNFTISINLSALDMAETALVPFIESSLKQFKIDPKYLILEVTESAVMDNPELFIDTINQLKALGFKISIDDFGTGYSSMLYLQNIEPNEIKIDMAFVRDIHLNRKKQHIVTAIVQLAHSNNAITVAEGVESDHELNFIAGLRCDYAQGYHWCPAIPLSDFEQQYLKATPPKP
jgi:EAL domain-containing protein (putative c-di-GMP-specific phosphodiesterase class I)/GGDEF domain-containing protein